MIEKLQNKIMQLTTDNPKFPRETNKENVVPIALQSSRSETNF